MNPITHSWWSSVAHDTESKCAIFLLLAAISTGQRPDVAAGQERSQIEAQPKTTQKTPVAQMPPNCIADKSGFKDKSYVVELANLCERRVRCKINAYIVTSRGPTSGRKTLTLAPASKGAAAHKVYVMKLTEAGGTADVSRQCKML
jgi:hypothetical protein